MPEINLNLNLMSLAELKKLEKDVTKAVLTFETRKKAAAISALEDMAKELGFKLEDLAGTSVTKSRASAQAKYAHPDDATITWSGRGRQPHWLKAELEAGKSLEEFAI